MEDVRIACAKPGRARTAAIASGIAGLGANNIADLAMELTCAGPRLRP
jgi:hypothetical protein